jgi:hypothetical protein
MMFLTNRPSRNGFPCSSAAAASGARRALGGRDAPGHYCHTRTTLLSSAVSHGAGTPAPAWEVSTGPRYWRNRAPPPAWPR